MNTKIIRGIEVTRPAITPFKSSVLDHATVKDNVAFGWTNNAGLWPSYNCMDTLVPTALCPDPVAAKVTKTFDFAEWTPGFEFAVYGGVQCSNVGLDREDMMSEAKRVFDLNVGKGIEQALLGNRFVATTSDDPVQWDAPVDVTPAASTLTLLQAIGVLEGYAAALYAGVPTLHMPRALVTMAFGAGALVEVDGKFYTKAGSKIAAGGGYDNTAVPNGVYDIYATGEVYVEMADEFSANAYVIPGDGLSQTGSDDPNQFTDNSSLVLVEQMFRVAVDCFVAKATATVWA